MGLKESMPDNLKTHALALLNRPSRTIGRPHPRNVTRFVHSAQMGDMEVSGETVPRDCGRRAPCRGRRGGPGDQGVTGKVLARMAQVDDRERMKQELFGESDSDSDTEDDKRKRLARLAVKKRKEAVRLEFSYCVAQASKHSTVLPNAAAPLPHRRSIMGALGRAMQEAQQEQEQHKKNKRRRTSYAPDDRLEEHPDRVGDPGAAHDQEDDRGCSGDRR